MLQFISVVTAIYLSYFYLIGLLYCFDSRYCTLRPVQFKLLAWWSPACQVITLILRRGLQQPLQKIAPVLKTRSQGVKILFHKPLNYSFTLIQATKFEPTTSPRLKNLNRKTGFLDWKTGNQVSRRKAGFLGQKKKKTLFFKFVC